MIGGGGVSDEEEERESVHYGTVSKKKSRTKVRYISLKPLTKKERRRQQKMAAEMALEAAAAEAAAEAAAAAGGSGGGGGEAGEDKEDDWTPPSPVALPDPSTVKPILVQLGFQLTNEDKAKRQKKSKTRIAVK